MSARKIKPARRRTLSDNFEEIYLRFNTSKRDLLKTDADVLKTKDFARVVSHMSQKYYKYNMKSFKKWGVEYEDVKSIITLFGAVYTGNVKDKNFSKKEYYGIMMSFIDQRMGNVLRWFSRKFESESIISVSDCIENLSDTSGNTVQTDTNSELFKFFKILPENISFSQIKEAEIETKSYLKKNKKNLTKKQKERVQKLEMQWRKFKRASLVDDEGLLAKMIKDGTAKNKILSAINAGKLDKETKGYALKLLGDINVK